MSQTKTVSMSQKLFSSISRKSDEAEIHWTRKAGDSLGQELVDKLQQGEFLEVRNLLTRRTRRLVSSKMVKQSWQEAVLAMGPVVSVGFGELTEAANGTVVQFPVVFEKNSVDVVVTVDETGHLSAVRGILNFSSMPWTEPSSVSAKCFKEEEIKLGSGDRLVEATLNLPNPSATFGTVILLQGSQDLARVLASRGFASIRFDEDTCGDVIENCAGDEEYICQAAISLLKQRVPTKDLPIFVLGHSLDGDAAPRKDMEENPSSGGYLIFGGSDQTLHWTSIPSLKYMIDLEEKTRIATRSVIFAAARQAKFVDIPQTARSPPVGVSVRQSRPNM